MRETFDTMMTAARAQVFTPPETRLRRLDSLARMLRDNESAIIQAISDDFNGRAKQETQLAEILPTLSGIRHAKRHLRRWMRPRRVPTPLHLKPARGHIQPMPLGLAGILAPWNYPLFLTTGPLIGAFAAGNRAMVKVSEHCPAFAEWLSFTVPRYFAADELAIVTGGPDVAAAFTELPFDHLIFTGSTSVGRHVMRAASENLTPVTLELGGKSPVIITEKANLARAIDRVMFGKTLNAGQTCVAPDYVLIPRPMMDDFITGSKAWIARHYPKIAASPDYTHIINAGQFTRLTGLIEGARQAGATIIPLTDAAADETTRFLPPVIVTGAPDDGRLLREEIFGPILPVIPTDGPAEALRIIHDRPRPLAAYIFSDDSAQIEKLQSGIVAGGICVNDTIMHVAHENLPFGGIGEAGIGAYHGQAGFDRLSHLKPVFTQSKLNALGQLLPPYGPRFASMMKLLKRFA